jgi:glycosyltransferase involved in cell wall biosynthesis
MSEPTVSVIVTYNVEPPEMLQRALSSVLMQSVTDIEVLLITHAQPAPQSSCDRVRVLHVDPCGVYEKWNLAAQVARGRYIAICPADDEWLPGKLQACLDAIGNASLVTHQTQHVDADGNPRITGRCAMEQVRARTRDQWRDRFHTGNCIFAATILYPRAVHAEIGWFDETLTNMGDLDFYARCNEAGGIVVVEQVYSRTQASTDMGPVIRSTAASDLATIRQRYYA